MFPPADAEGFQWPGFDFAWHAPTDGTHETAIPRLIIVSTEGNQGVLFEVLVQPASSGTPLQLAAQPDYLPLKRYLGMPLVSLGRSQVEGDTGLLYRSQAHWLPLVAQRARDYLHAHLHQDIGLDHLAAACSVDRFRLSRAFKAAFGLAPHAYLVQLRLARARRQLAAGRSPAHVAFDLGFADQSHLGRWFLRAYGMTPAQYRRRCTNRPD